MIRHLPKLLMALALAVLLASGSTFTVNQGQTAIVLRLGEVIREDVQPGLRFKVPLIDSVRLETEDKLTILYPQKSSVNIWALDYTVK